MSCRGSGQTPIIPEQRPIMHKYAPKYPDEARLHKNFAALVLFKQDFRKAASVTLRGILRQKENRITRGENIH